MTLYAFLVSIHTICILLLVGGIAAIDTIFLPHFLKYSDPKRALNEYMDVENRYVFWGRISLFLTFLTGLILLFLTGGTGQLGSLQNWWIILMILTWFVIFILFFIFGPYNFIQKFILKNSADAFNGIKFLSKFYKLILILSLITVFGSVSGSHGVVFY